MQSSGTFSVTVNGHDVSSMLSSEICSILQPLDRCGFWVRLGSNTGYIRSKYRCGFLVRLGSITGYIRSKCRRGFWVRLSSHTGYIRSK